MTTDALDRELRPVELDDIIGQDKMRRSLQVFLQAAKARDEAMDHILLRGQPGLGKTTFALAIANALGYTLIHKVGPAFDNEAVITLVQYSLAPKANMRSALGLKRDERFVVFIDEVHAVPKDAFETMYPLIEDFEFQGRKVPKFTLIAATTDPGKLPQPFRSRFGIDYLIDYYKDEDLLRILQRSHRILMGDKEIDDEVGLSIAARSRGTPRRANILLRRAIDYAEVSDDGIVTMEVLQAAMEGLGVDRVGLEEAERKMLMAMATRFNRPVGLAAIASAIGEDQRNLERAIEPFLVRQGFINRERGGRVLTPDGIVLAALALEDKVPY